jgi:hypothetical protein
LVILFGIVLGGSHMLGLPSIFLTASEEESFADPPEQLVRARNRSNKPQTRRCSWLSQLPHRARFPYVRLRSLLNLRSISPNLRI